MNKFSDLLVRAIAALVGAAIILFGVAWNQWTFFMLILIITAFATREFTRLADLPGRLMIWSYLASIIIVVIFYGVASSQISADYLFLIFPISLTGLVLQLYETNDRPLRSMAMHFLGLGYIGVSLGLMCYLAFHPAGFNPALPASIFILTWCLDSGAYFAGSALGKHKLFEKISPKKSWEGAIGGVVLCLIGAVIWSLYFSQLTMLEWMGAAAVIAISGIFGDLVESHMKRIADRKDSGTSIPGHGGFLDRFDSLFFAVPFFLAYLKVVL